MKRFYVSEVATTLTVHVVEACDGNDAVRVIQVARDGAWSIRPREEAIKQLIGSTQVKPLVQWSTVEIPADGTVFYDLGDPSKKRPVGT